MIDPDYIAALSAALGRVKPWRGRVPAGYVADWLGVLTPAAWKVHHCPEAEQESRHTRYVVTDIPSISEKYFETGNIALAVEDGGAAFVMVELGAAWGVRTAEAWALVQALRPMPVRFVAVDGQRQHAVWRQEHLRLNGVPAEACLSLHAAVGADTRPVFFPDLPGVLGQGKETDEALGFLRRLSDEQAHKALESLWATGVCGVEEDYTVQGVTMRRSWTVVSSVTIPQLLFGLETVDILDIDIQGTEDLVLTGAAPCLQERVKLVHIGTHGQKRHRRVRTFLAELGWQILADCPPKHDIATALGPLRTKDGFVTARNPVLMAPFPTAA